MAKTLVYQLYPRSWQGLAEMEDFLYQIAELDVDYVWLSPIYSSPMNDGGYDIANYKDIDRRYGRFYDFDHFVDTAHELNIGVLMDLVLNHTSTSHKWFSHHPERYCWSKTNRPGWKNIFDGGSTWQYCEEREEYYLHFFHRYQADLNWFPDGKLNSRLVQKFQDIVDFWMSKHAVDGFRLDAVQAINKDFSADILTVDELIFGDKAAEVINAVFDNSDAFLMMECLDPTFGELIDYYTKNTGIDFVFNILTKEQISQGEETLLSLIAKQAQNPHFMLELESHDAPRFPSRKIIVQGNEHPKEITPSDAIWYLFNSGAEGICLYQGQELGLKNPTRHELPDRMMFDLDAQTAMRYIKGESASSLRPLSRANARVPLPLDEYVLQEQIPSSYLNLTKGWIQRWRNR